MITVTSTELNAWIASFLWPLTRILGLIATAPLFGNLSIPMRIKVALGVMLAMIVTPNIPPMPSVEPMSLAGLLIVIQQLMIGLAMGFVMRIIFASVEMAGEIASLTMGLGFATFFDPNTRGRSSAISQFLALIAITFFLAANVHLMMLSALTHSFSTLPILAEPLSNGGFKQLATWGGHIFSIGVQLSLPVVAALLIVNTALGILTRAAPQLNLFGIGFPVTLGAGLIVLGLSLPYLATPLSRVFEEGIGMMRQITDYMLPTLR